MTSIFPQLLTYEFFAPTILRIVLAIILISYGFNKLKESGAIADVTSSLGAGSRNLWFKAIATLEIISGLLLLIGFLTQIAVIITSLIFIVTIIKTKIRKGFIEGYDFEIILLAVSLSLLLLGPGAFSIDLPL